MKIDALKSSVRLSISYKCQYCEHENHDYHYIDAVSTGTGNAAHRRNEDLLEKQLKEIAENTNPDLYPKLKLNCACSHCDVLPVWARFDFSKKYKTIKILVWVGVLAALLGSAISIPMIYTLIPFFVPALAIWLKIISLREESLKYLRELPHEYYPVFKLSEKDDK